MVRGGGSLLVFQKQLAPVVSTQINCYLSDLDAFSLLSIPQKSKTTRKIYEYTDDKMIITEKYNCYTLGRITGNKKKKNKESHTPLLFFLAII